LVCHVPLRAAWPPRHTALGSHSVHSHGAEYSGSRLQQKFTNRPLHPLVPVPWNTVLDTGSFWTQLLSESAQHPCRSGI
jgi:hypothetical protein